MKHRSLCRAAALLAIVSASAPAWAHPGHDHASLVDQLLHAFALDHLLSPSGGWPGLAMGLLAASALLVALGWGVAAAVPVWRRRGPGATIGHRHHARAHR